jgi:hypothetical protein
MQGRGGMRVRWPPPGSSTPSSCPSCPANSAKETRTPELTPISGTLAVSVCPGASREPTVTKLLDVTMHRLRKQQSFL